METKALHRILLQSLPRINDGLIVSDAQRPDDPVVYCNRAAELITGYAEHETLGRNMRFLQGPDTSEDARTAIREALEHEQSCTTVIKNYKKDGTPFWNEMSVVPIFDAGGTCTHVLGIIHDITAHRQDRRELQQSKRRLRRIIDAVPQCIFLKDEAGTYVLANKATARYLGTTRERLEGATDQEFASSGDGRDFRADDRSVLQTGEPKAFTETIVHADNEERIVQIEMLPFESALQDERQLLVIVTDITPRVRSEERWRRLVRYHPEPILISVDAKIQYVNAAGARAFGVSSADALIGESVLSFIAPAAHDEIRARSEAVKRGERTEPFEHRLIRPSGEERIVEAFSVPITYHGQAAAQTVVRDITEKKRAERQLRRREQQQAAVAKLGLHALEESDMRGLTQAAATQLQRQLQADAAAVLELLPIGRVLQPRACAPASASTDDVVNVTDDTFAQRVLQAEEPLPFTGTNRKKAPLGLPGAARGVAVAVQGRDHPYGILAVYSMTPRTFTTDDISFLQTVALLIGNAAERRHAEAELQLSEQRYRSVVEQQTELICRFKPDFSLTFVNHAFGAYVQKPIDRLVGTNLLNQLAASDHLPWRQTLQDSSPEQPVQKIEHRFINPHGDERWLQWTVRAFFNASGAAVEFQAAGRDVTERKALEREVMNASTLERQRIGQDLHDGLGSHLSGVAMLCRGVVRKIESGASVEASVMEEIAELVDDSINQVRTLAHGLNPVKTEEQGLRSALQGLVANAQAHLSTSASFAVEGDPPDLNSEVATHLYRIAQEAINNALKHASSSNIDVRLRANDDVLQLVVEDDGIGFSHDADLADGMGLRVMKYRANAIGAQLHVRPTDGTGTRITCVLPIRKIIQPPLSHAPSPTAYGT